MNTIYEGATLACNHVRLADGSRDLKDNFRMDCEFDRAEDGDIAVTGEVDLHKKSFKAWCQNENGQVSRDGNE